MNTEQAVQRLSEVIRRKHLALNTEQSYCAWLRRFCVFIRRLPPELPSEQKLERFLTALAKEDVAASTKIKRSVGLFIVWSPPPLAAA